MNNCPVTNNYYTDYQLNPTKENLIKLRDYSYMYNDMMVNCVINFQKNFNDTFLAFNENVKNTINALIDYQVSDTLLKSNLKTLKNLELAASRRMGTTSLCSPSINNEIMYNARNNANPENIKALSDSLSVLFKDLFSDMTDTYTLKYEKESILRGLLLDTTGNILFGSLQNFAALVTTFITQLQSFGQYGP